jgi:alkaline phosphatase D
LDHLSRRRFLALGGAAGAVGLGVTLGRRAVADVHTNRPPALRADPFTLGVASGDPWRDSVVLWTRLLPNPDDPHDNAIGPHVHDVHWQVATDPGMTRVEREGTAAAIPEHGHSVRVIVDGLRPSRDYWYRFRAGPWVSATGRTRTAPHPGQATDRLDIAVASCQSWGAGYYTAHRHLATEMPDVVVFLGDYIYERPITGHDSGRRLAAPIPAHLATEPDTLATYRARYAWYKRDPDLQAAHHAAPWIATWDDHEVEDNYAADVPGSSTSRAAFAARRAGAYQAYWEHLPLRGAPPVGSAMTMHRRVPFGALATFHVLDTRQHRSDQVPGAAWQHASAERADPRRTMLGAEQQRWLEGGLARSKATWNVVAQQVVASRLNVDARDRGLLNADTWDGYPAAQRLLHDALATAANPVVLTGDLHAAYAFDIRAPLDDPDGRPRAVEFATTSISSGGDGTELSSAGHRFLAANPHLHYANQRRGYLRCRLTPDAVTADFRVVPYVAGRADAPVSTDRSFVVPAGARTVHAA